MADQSDDNEPLPVTRLLQAWQQGNRAAEADVAAAVHAELKRIAASRLRRERGDHTLQPTALVNEAWMRLARVKSDWQNRAQFLGAAAVAMRRILVEHARRRDAVKRGDGAVKVPLDDALDAIRAPMPDDRLLALDVALTRLEALDPRQARIVELRYFTGLSIEETAALLDISTGTVKREWATARAWLYDAVQQGG
ncbi:MAG: ECF-type sigma factor [Vicinamibacterales bacterium]